MFTSKIGILKISKETEISLFRRRKPVICFRRGFCFPGGFRSPPGNSTVLISQVYCRLQHLRVSIIRKISKNEHSFLERLLIKVVLLLNIWINRYWRKTLCCFWALITLVLNRLVWSEACRQGTAQWGFHNTRSTTALVPRVPSCQLLCGRYSMGMRKWKDLLIHEWCCIYCGGTVLYRALEHPPGIIYFNKYVLRLRPHIFMWHLKTTAV